jgi:hypothetical protein
MTAGARPGPPTSDDPGDLSADGLGGQSIAEAARQLGIPEPTLRSWERRYQIPRWDRTVGQRRQYSAEHLHGLRLMRDQISRGQRAAAAADSVRELLRDAGPHAGFVAEVLAAARGSDTGGVVDHLSRAHAALGLGPCVDDVLLPVMQQVGLWWRTGRCDVEQERLATAAVRGWLKGLVDSAPTPVRPEPVLLACGPIDQHTVGLESFTVLLRYRLRSCHVLGAATLTDALAAAIGETGAAAVVIVSHVNVGRQRAIESLHAANQPGVAVFYAGNAFSSNRGRRNLPGTYLGTNLQRASDVLDVELSVTDPVPEH